MRRFTGIQVLDDRVMSSARLSNAGRAVVAPAFAAPEGGGSLNVIVAGFLDAR